MRYVEMTDRQREGKDIYHSDNHIKRQIQT